MKTFLLRLKKFFSPLGVFKKRVKLGLSIAKADQKGIFAKKNTSKLILSVPAKLQIFMLLVCATTSRVKYIHTVTAIMQGAAMEAISSTVRMPIPVLMIYTAANTPNEPIIKAKEVFRNAI